MTNKLLAIIGATASGKTGLAVSLAQKYNAEIISADSRQVYRGLDLGSGKDLHEYGEVPYHLIDIAEPQEEYNLFRYQNDFRQAYLAVQNNHKNAILCGGSSMYLHSVLSNYQLTKAQIEPQLVEQLQKLSDQELAQKLVELLPEQHNQTDLLDRERLIRALTIAQSEKTSSSILNSLSLKPLIIALEWPRDVRRERIKQRLKERLDAGMIDEVETLHKQGVSWEKLVFFGLEYRFIAQYLQQQLNYNDMFQKLNSAIVKFAKKQDTWLRKMTREGLEIHRIEGGPDMLSEAEHIIQTHHYLN